MSDENTQPEAEGYPRHEQPFEVVLLKNGVNSLTAKPEDFQRIRVDAVDPLQAMQHGDVSNVEGYTCLFAVPPGAPTEPEQMARQRQTISSGPGAAQ